MKKMFFLWVAAFAFTLSAQAQIKTPAPSPSAKLTQEVGLVKIDVDYSRPSAKGRKVFGELVTFGEIWRTGANAATKLTFSDDLTLGGAKIAKGSYALYTIPMEKEWTIIIYKNTTLGGNLKEVKEEELAAKFNVPSLRLNDAVETFTIGFDNLRNASADLVLTWEKTKVVVPIMLDTDSKVVADIKKVMAGPDANAYYAASRYYFEEKKDMKQALEWVNKSLEMGGDKFWILRMKSQVQAELGMYKDAIATAEKSLDLAKADGNMDYVRMNEKSIGEWKMKK
ncbi:MAG TPA: DUF2911 domain-containing protein [Saprospiraceae bacterium]|nr:DUF2911 domain-containing protein [Saprospiraceae bacterium]